MVMSSPPNPSTPAGEHPWRKAYLRFRELEQRLTDDDPDGWAFLTLLQAAGQGRRYFDATLLEYKAACLGIKSGLPGPPDSLVSEFGTIADLRSSYDSAEAGFVFEDVYHLAFDRLTWWQGYPTASTRCQKQPSDSLWLYRGQRKDSWEVGATIYRGLPEGPKRRAELQSRAASACQVGYAIANRLGLSFKDAMAVAQHYSAADILGTPTWLVDFSRNPWVGLFFATEGGESGDLGVVWAIKPSEYAAICAGKGNPIGPLQLVVPRGVERIDNQAGVFVIAGLPQIFHQYVGFGWDTRFRQHTGLVFEDPVLGIGAQTIYPPDDPLRSVLAEVRSASVDCGCETGTTPCAVSSAVFTDPFDPSTYESLLACWLTEFLTARAHDFEPVYLRDAFADLARFHARLQSPDYADRLPLPSSRSLNRLRATFDKLASHALQDAPISLRIAVESTYVNQTAGNRDHITVLREALNEILGP